MRDRTNQLSEYGGAKPLRCRGFSLIEVVVAVTALTVLFVVLAQVLATFARQRRSSARRLLAVEEAANALEQAALVPYAELTSERVQGIRFSERATKSLRQARLSIHVDSSAGTPAGKRVRVEVVWQDDAGQTTRPVRLTAWRYPINEWRPDPSHRDSP